MKARADAVGTIVRLLRFGPKENLMSKIKDYVKSLATEVNGKAEKTDPEKGDVKTRSMPQKPDPEEVQYPGYFKDGGSL
ncbi:hypothetical protein [Pararhizobium gei]|uniref:hypothetical protein n=1 Tax=Pararhizobium gei TaxID=1395951 RepID=UPI0023DAD31A|nr:hypothetical protein [Rhizobium gei]